MYLIKVKLIGHVKIPRNKRIKSQWSSPSRTVELHKFRICIRFENEACLAISHALRSHIFRPVNFPLVLLTFTVTHTVYVVVSFLLHFSGVALIIAQTIEYLIKYFLFNLQKLWHYHNITLFCGNWTFLHSTKKIIKINIKNYKFYYYNKLNYNKYKLVNMCIYRALSTKITSVTGNELSGSKKYV